MNIPSPFMGGLFLAVGMFLSGQTGRAQENNAVPVFGEVAAVRHATINEEYAVSGRTLFRQDRISTAEQGKAFLNLGRQGQIEVESETTFQLHLADKTVAGELQKGRIVISSPANTGIAIKTLRAEVLARNAQATILSLEVIEDRLIAVSYQGDVTLRSPSKSAFLRGGEALSFNLQKEEWTPQILTRPNQSIGMEAEKNSYQRSAMTFLGLIFASLCDSLNSIYSTFQQPSTSFDTTITCRDQNNLPCHILGGITP